jgi:hypothetical protein
MKHTEGLWRSSILKLDISLHRNGKLKPPIIHDQMIKQYVPDVPTSPYTRAYLPNLVGWDYKRTMIQEH